MSAMHHRVNIEKLADISYRGVRRAAVFLGLGVNAARNPKFNQYQLGHLSLIQTIPQNLPKEQIDTFKEHFESWIVRSALRELIESFDLFLEKLHHTCLLIGTSKGSICENKADRWGPKFPNEGVDGKLKLLRERFDVFTSKEHYFQAIKQVRNCVTHRRSIVGAKDVDENKDLHLKWWRIQLFMKMDSGEEVEIKPPFSENSYFSEETGTVCLKIHDKERIYKPGDPIKLNPNDILEICELTKMATSELLKSLVKYAQNQEVPIVEKQKS